MLRSDLYRVYALIAVFSVSLILRIVLPMIDEETDATIGIGQAFWYFTPSVLVYQGSLMLWIRWTLKRDRSIPPVFWFLNAVIDSSLPTFTIALALMGEIQTADAALRSPSLLGYAILTILAILRLRPGLTLLSGIVAATGYTILTSIAHTRGDIPSPDGGPTLVGYYTNGIVLLMVAGAATWVTVRARQHVFTEVRETERRQIYERDLAAAATIQKGLLPVAPPAIAGFTFAGWSRPADASGGDYYDWTDLPGDRAVAYVADVTGHGLPAATISAFCRAYSRATFDPEVPLHESLRTLDTLLQEDLPEAKFVTFVAAMFEAGSDEIRLLSAGHGPILIYRSKTRTVERRSADGVPLGLGVGGYADTPTVALETGDALLMLTDGFFEWPNAAGDRFGLDRLDDSVVRHASDDPAAWIRLVLADVEVFASGVPQEDDVTAVVVRRT